MKPLREWIQEELDKALQGEAAGACLGIKSRYWIGYGKAMDTVLKELKAREDQGQESQDSEEERNADVGEDMARDRHEKAKRLRGPRGGYPRETWGDLE